MMPIFNNFFFNHTPATKLSTLSLHDALPILLLMPTLNFLPVWFALSLLRFRLPSKRTKQAKKDRKSGSAGMPRPISYAVFCLKKKTSTHRRPTPSDTHDPPGCEDGHHPSQDC